MSSATEKDGTPLWILLFGASYWAFAISNPFFFGCLKHAEAFGIELLVPNMIAHAVGLVVVFALCRLKGVSRRTLLITACLISLLGSAGILLCDNLPGLMSASILFSIVMGIGASGILIAWVTMFASEEAESQLWTSISGSVVVGLLLLLFITCLPTAFANAIELFLPVSALIAGLQFGRHSGSVQIRATSPKPTRLPIALYICCFVFALATGLIRGIVTTDGTLSDSQSWPSVISITLVPMLFAILLSYYFLHTKGFAVILKAAIPLLTAGLLLCATVDTKGPYPISLVLASHYLFAVFIYTELALLAGKSAGNLVAMFCIGVCLIDVGLGAGLSMLPIVQSILPVNPTSVIVVVLYLVILASSGLFREIGGKSTRPEQTPEASELIAPESENSLSEIIANRSNELADTYNLSPAERKVLPYLVKGKELKAIADDLCLSPNTVKTHVAHIYQKLDIHNREGLMRMLEEVRQ